MPSYFSITNTDDPTKITSEMVTNKDSTGWNLIHYAARDSACKILRALIEMGADINVKKADGFTPLMLACLNDNREAAQILIQHGVDTTQEYNTDRYGRRLNSLTRIHPGHLERWITQYGIKPILII